MEKLSNFVGGAWAFAGAHPFVSGWLALTSAWALFTFARRDNA